MCPALEKVMSTQAGESQGVWSVVWNYNAVRVVHTEFMKISQYEFTTYEEE